MDPEVGEQGGGSARRAAFDAYRRRRDAARTEEFHGSGRILGLQGRPQRAEGCLLPDGTVTDATVVALPDDTRASGPGGGIGFALAEGGQDGDADTEGAARRIDPEACIWSRRLVSDGAVTRRGRLVVEPGVALRFVDALDAGEGQGEGADGQASLLPSLDRDLNRSPAAIRRVGSDLFARLLYAALCNTEWHHRATGQLWSCSWRSAGDVVADMRGEGNYMDWYCSGGEGLVDEVVLMEVEALGWALVTNADGPTSDADQSPATTSGDAP